MPAFHIERSIRIQAPAAKVRPAIEDFAVWPKWSPWLYMEPSANLQVHGSAGQIGHGYEWSGELVGAGSMELTAAEPEKLKMDLSFIKPFRSQSHVEMEIQPVAENETNVTWHMFGKCPFFMFFMVKSMKAMIGMDYERGLRMLKEYVEKGSISSQTEVVGVVDLPKTPFVGVEDRCFMKQLGDSMSRTLPQAHKLATANGVATDGAPGAIYNKFCMSNQSFHYTAIVPATREAEIDGAVSGNIGACKALKVIHRGSYDHLGNSWSTAMAHQRHGKLKPLKKKPMFELYATDPGETPEEDLITEIYIPLRG